MLADFGGAKKDFTPYGLQKILSDNGYVKIKDARTVDAKGGKYEIYGDVVTLKSATPATVKYETSNGFVQTIGRKKWDELAKKVSDGSASAIDKAIRALDEEKYFYYQGDYKKSNTAEEALNEIKRLISIAKRYDGKEKSWSFGFISGDITRILMIPKIWSANPKSNKLFKEATILKNEASAIAKKNRP